MQDRLNQDLKQAMLAGDKTKAETLKVIKGVLQNAQIAKGPQSKELSDDEVVKILSSEAKKRTEAAKLYENAEEEQRAASEKAELDILKTYLPQQMDEMQLRELISRKIAELNATSSADIGKVIGSVKAEVGASADGAVVARLAKELLG